MIIPYIDEYNSEIRDLVIVNNPDDVERLVNTHVKKTPHLKPLLYNSIISTTDVDLWKQQRQNYQPAFSVESQLKKLVPISNKRAKFSIDILVSNPQSETKQGIRIQLRPKEGVMDPAKVTRLALEKSSSVGALLMTTECVIADDPEEDASKNAAPSPMGGGMGGMM